MKIGRNDKCPCKSGKKYKDCCYKKKQVQSQSYFIPKVEGFGVPPDVDWMLPPSIDNILILKFFSEKHFDFKKEWNSLQNEVFDSVDHEKPAIDFIKDHIWLTEEKIQSIASKYSTYEMLFWSRRLGPKNIFNVSDLSIMLYRDVQSLAIYKYGARDNDMVFAGNSVFPHYLTEYNGLDYTTCLERIRTEGLDKHFVNTLSDVIRIEILCYLFVRATQLFRIANKGGEIVASKVSKQLVHTIDEEIDFLMSLYDQRLSKTNLFSMTGTYLNYRLNENNSFFCPHFQLNADHKEKIEFIRYHNEAYLKIYKNGNEVIRTTPNYLLGGLSLINIYNFLCLFEDEFENHYSFSIKDFVLFLGYWGYKIAKDFSQGLDVQYQIMNRAYFVDVFDTKEIPKEFLVVYPKLHESVFGDVQEGNTHSANIFESFFLKTENKNDIDLWTRGPKRFLYQLSEKHVVVDYTCLTNIVSYIVKEITSVDGEVGNKRATHFEEALVSEGEIIFGKDSFWVSRAKILSDNGEKEIDASLIVEDILFVFEAKAVNVSFGYDKGDKKAIDFRINKMKIALNEVELKAKFIQKNKSSLTPTLPEKVRFICPLVISSYPEYIWSTSDDLFISKEKMLPRVLTVSDLETLKTLDLNVLRKKEWVLSIK